MRTRFLGIFLALALVTGAAAEDFSLYGGRFGMTRAELKKVWVALASGEFHVKEGALFAIRPEFDHEDRMFKVSFQAPLGDKYPFSMTSAAYQNLVNRLWGGRPELIVSVRAGKESAETTVTHRKLLEEYMKAIEAELVPLIRP